MNNIQCLLNLPEGKFTSTLIEFDESDILPLWRIYNNWQNLCKELNSMGARGVNLPEGLSESVFCIAKNMHRFTASITGANTSFDCYDINASVYKNRIQVKACSVLPDLTSFGPKSQWDRIFFVDFYRHGDWDGSFDIYEIKTSDIENYPVNQTQTVKDQKLQNRRPRFSIYSGLICNGKYISKETFKITQTGIISI